MIGRFVPAAELVGVLILFRLIHHIVSLARMLLAGFEIAHRRRRGRLTVEPASKTEA